MYSIILAGLILTSARELTLEAAQSAGSARTVNSRPSNRELPFAQTKKLLDSRNDREILEGLRKVISMMYRSKPCLPFFSAVIKNVASPNIEIKKLVYIYLLHYAESEPDLALLSINTIQKSLSDQSPQVRAMALRVMSGIKVPVISQIVSLGIKKGCADMSPYVRKAAALAIPKCYRLDPNTLPQLLDYLSILLGDKQYYVVGAAVNAFLEVCPDRMDLIHKHYRGLVRKLVDMDEWGQLATLNLLIVYARKCFPIRTKKVKKNKSKGFYEDEASEQEDEYSGEEVQVLHPDLELFLKACKPLLSSRNSAVIVSTARCFLHLGTSEYIDAAIGPLVALLRSPLDIQQVAMNNLVAVCLVRAESFVKYAGHFLVRATDPPDVSRSKFEILTLIFPHCEPHMKEMILSELEHFTRAADTALVQESVRAIGRCAQNESTASMRCLRLLLDQLSSQDGGLVADSLTVIRHLIQQNPQAHVQTVIRLAKNLDTTTNSEARASIVWLVGEFSGLPEEDNIAPDVLRILAKGFADESEAAKLQIVLLAAKVYLHYLIRTSPPQTEALANAPSTQTVEEASIQISAPAEENGWQDTYPLPSTDQPATEPEKDSTHPIPLLWTYVLHLTRYDTSYDLRDRTRLYRALLSDPHSTQLASLLLLAPKPVPHTPSPSENRKDLLIGSSSLVIGVEAAGIDGVMGYEGLPEWVKEGEEPDAKLRDEVGGKEAHGEKKDMPAARELDKAIEKKGLGKIGVGGAKDKTLDDWLAEEEGSEEGSTEEETESESEEESSEDEESESEGGEEGDRLVN
ncbi:MAG: AP-3 complex subunit beta [Alectoria fallacina]|uniref:AP-3 complex subunit beta n=1 Tax=Alectoria fallacina TaxID=1903189 RepID=A0A8H3F725_9LECA|nr:MAG: AP-3 complex subunit beta [Alectoria fallacina]